MPLVLSGDGAVGPLSATEVSYLDGVTSAVQTQLAGKADTTSNGAWTSWTPSFTNLTVGNGAVTGSYVRMGKVVVARFSFTMGSTSSITGNVAVTLPVTAATYSKQAMIGNLFMEDAGTLGYVGFIVSGGGLYYVSSASGALTVIAATIPFTWGTNDFFAGTLIYEAA